MPDVGAAILAWATSVLLALGYVGLALLVALETIVPPIPSEVILPLAGFFAGQGHFSVVGLVLAATAGSVVGALVFYMLGRMLGAQRLRSFVKTRGRWILLDESDLDTAQEWFRQRGAWAVLIGRLVPAVRSYVSVPAGVAHMPLGAFMLLTMLGSGLWNALLIGGGWLLGERWNGARRVGPGRRGRLVAGDDARHQDEEIAAPNLSSVVYTALCPRSSAMPTTRQFWWAFQR